MVILIAGSTGLVGAEVALKLQRHGQKVLAPVRGGGLNPKAQRLLDAGIKVLEGDLTRPDTLLPTCAVVEAVVTTTTSMPGSAELPGFITRWV